MSHEMSKWNITWKNSDLWHLNKTLIDSKPLWIRFDEIDGIIRIYDGTRYLTLFRTKIYHTIYDRII